MQHLARENRCLPSANCHFSNLTKIVPRESGERLERHAASGSGSAGAVSADSSVLPQCKFAESFSSCTDTAKSPAPTQMFLQQLPVTLLHGYNAIPRGSWSTSAFQEDSLLMKSNAQRSMRCGALSNILSQLEQLLNCHCLVQWCFTPLYKFLQSKLLVKSSNFPLIAKRCEDWNDLPVGRMLTLEWESEGLQTVGIVVIIFASLKLLHLLGLIDFSEGKVITHILCCLQVWCLIC